ncbi:MAG: glycine cleavage system protein GcvH [Verrucomicrobia bacterium]|jgi:glycine cleavage system H protein|nr:glycine cleavage system protein GcvH [Verrucomicrobiota bacterium]MBT7701167.1 glycine cleavage system protein GcvH [Verrucomicrobiota bacterium]
MSMDDRKYAKSHEWAKMDGAVVVVGISDHAQQELGDITFVELPAVGDTVAAGGECGVIESVKAASDLYAPVGGEVVEVNMALEDAPELINQDAFEAGWIMKLKPADVAELDSLMSAEEYDALM